MEAIQSIILKTSPVKTNMPFINSKPAQKRRKYKGGVIPNTNIKKAIAERISIAPKTLTNIKKSRSLGLISFRWFNFIF